MITDSTQSYYQYISPAHWLTLVWDCWVWVTLISFFLWSKQNLRFYWSREETRKPFCSGLQNVYVMKLPRIEHPYFLFMVTTKWMNYRRDFSQPSELPLSNCFGYPDHVCFRIFPSPLWANRNEKKNFSLQNLYVLVFPSIAFILSWNFQQLVVIW